MGDISEAVRLYDEMKRRLEAEVPDIDEETLLDTLEGCTDLHECIASLCRAAKDAEAMSEACNKRAGEIHDRARRHAARGERLRDIALWCMSEAGIPKVQQPDITISVGSTRPSVMITDEKLIPVQYLKTQMSVSKTAIKEAIDAGKDVPGALLSNAKPSLMVRTK